MFRNFILKEKTMKNSFKGFHKVYRKVVKEYVSFLKKRSMKNNVWRFLKVSKKTIGKYS
jgi:hypothetical protein